MNTTTLFNILEKFSGMPIECLTHKKLEKLYGILLNFLLENDENLTDEFHDLLERTILLIAQELERQDKELPNLAKQLIQDPSSVEQVLSQMSFSELLQAEKKIRTLKPLALRQQFANMIARSMHNLCHDCRLLPC